MVVSYDNAECKAVAVELLRRHGELQPEANITSQIREFLVRTGLVESGDIREEVAPAEGSSNSVDLAASGHVDRGEAADREWDRA